VTVSSQPEFIVISGLSGSGKSAAVKNFEDLGAYCVDNLPTALLPKVLELFGESTMDLRLVVIGMDIRGRNFIKGFPEIFRSLRTSGIPIRLLFFTAAEKVLVRRYGETRRVHPLGGSGSLLEAIRREKKELEPLKELADQVVDTSRTSLRDLREEVCNICQERRAPGRLSITLLSFGYKYGVPFDADLVFDVRFLPNPFFVEELKHQTGLDDPVRDFVMKKKETGEFVEEFHRFLKFLIPRCRAEGRAYLTIAIGCTGGRHRSVAVARAAAAFLEDKGGAVSVRNRDIQGE
jgi:UPF0042 nucleotide-binding protein